MIDATYFGKLAASSFNGSSRRPTIYTLCAPFSARAVAIIFPIPGRGYRLCQQLARTVCERRLCGSSIGMRTCASPCDDGYKAIYVEQVIYPEGATVKPGRRHAGAVGNEPAARGFELQSDDKLRRGKYSKRQALTIPYLKDHEKGKNKPTR